MANSRGRSKPNPINAAAHGQRGPDQAGTSEKFSLESQEIIVSLLHFGGIRVFNPWLPMLEERDQARMAQAGAAETAPGFRPTGIGVIAVRDS